MVNTNEIRAQMARKGFNITKLAREIGVSTKTLSVKLSKSPGKFTQIEMQDIAETLDIKEPGKIFFAS